MSTTLGLRAISDDEYDTAHCKVAYLSPYYAVIAYFGMPFDGESFKLQNSYIKLIYLAALDPQN